jgi:L-ascorbate metabolism protein UlaG (beta-lactamase superfamily)
MKLNPVLKVFAVFLALSSCTCQKTSTLYKAPAGLLNSPANFFSQPEKYLDWQSGHLLSTAEEALLKNPPKTEETMERHMALLMLDAVFHNTAAPELFAVQEFHKKRTLLALDEMKRTRVNKGAVIWKLYDMGTIVRTGSTTVAFDIIRGKSAKAENFNLPDSLMGEIISQCDILFLSHNHGDHVDKWVAQKFIEQGKPVIANEEILKGEEIFHQITHPERNGNKKQYIPIQSGKRKLEIVVYPGHQGALLDNVTVVRMPEGITVCHTGDESNRDDFQWIDTAGKNIKIDVLIPNCWTPDPLRVAKGFNPHLIIPAHENELGHTIDHREAYALNYSRWNIPYKKVFMTWGESFHYEAK